MFKPTTSNGKYVVELSDNLDHTNNIYLQISPKQQIANYFDTPNGKQFEINQNEIKPNEKLKTAVKYGSEKSDNFTLQIENNNPSNNNESGTTGRAVIGFIIGALSELLLLGWLLKKFVVIPFICEPIRKKKVEAFRRQTAKDIAQMKANEKEEQEKNK